MKRILMSSDTVGGVWTYSLELSRALRHYGVKVGLAAMGAPLALQQRKDALDAGNIELFESAYRLEWMEDPWDDVRKAGGWLIELEDRFAPDIIHLNSYSHGSLPFEKPVLVAAHSCVLSWWRALKGGRAPAAWDRYRQEVREGLGKADFIVAPSKTMLSSIRADYGAQAPGAVVYNGRDPAGFRTGPKEDIVFTAGRLWDEAKGTAALAEVACELPWPVYAAGEEKPGSEAKSNFTPLGRLSQREVLGWFSRAPIYALPAFYEPFGLSVLEAALSGAALVLGDIESLRELWDGAVVFVPPGDKKSLKHAILSLIESPGLLASAASLSGRRALEYSHTRMAGAYMAIYNRLGASKRGERRSAGRKETSDCVS